MKLHSEAESTISSHDVLEVIKKKKIFIILAAVLCAILCVSWRLIQPLQYPAEGVFREKVRNPNQGKSSSLALMLMTGLNAEGYGEGKVLMTSPLLLKQVIEKLCLQAIIKEQTLWERVIKRVCDNCIVEWNYFNHLRHPSPQGSPSPLNISSLRFNGAYPLEFSLHFLSEEQFELEHLDGTPVGTGYLGRPFETPEYSFTLFNEGKQRLAGSVYSFELQPLLTIFSRLSKNLIIQSEKETPGLIALSYSNEHPVIAARVVNEIMDSYQSYLKQELQRVSQEQISYLDQRATEMNHDLERLLEDYAKTLKADLITFGYVDTEAAIKFFSEKFQELHKRTQQIDIELQQLESALKEPPEILIDLYLRVPDVPSFMTQLVDSIATLRRESQLISLSQRRSFKNIEETAVGPFQDLSLIGAQALYETYNRQLAELENQKMHYGFLIEQIHHPEVEMHTLASLIQDSAMKEWATRTQDLALHLQDEYNRGAKEKERIQRELLSKREFFATHLEKIRDLADQHQSQIGTHFDQLQQTRWHLLQTQISLLETEFREAVKTHIENQKQEKHLLEEQADRMRAELALLPQRWIAEKAVAERLGVHTKMVEEISKLVESKNINNNLETIQSAPLIPAIQLTHPKRPYLWAYMMIGAILGAVFSGAFCIIKENFT